MIWYVYLKRDRCQLHLCYDTTSTHQIPRILISEKVDMYAIMILDAHEFTIGNDPAKMINFESVHLMTNQTL